MKSAQAGLMALRQPYGHFHDNLAPVGTVEVNEKILQGHEVLLFNHIYARRLAAIGNKRHSCFLLVSFYEAYRFWQLIHINENRGRPAAIQACFAPFSREDSQRCLQTDGF